MSTHGMKWKTPDELYGTLGGTTMLLTMPVQLKRQLRAYATQHRKSMNEVVRESIKLYLLLRRKRD